MIQKVISLLAIMIGIQILVWVLKIILYLQRIIRYGDIIIYVIVSVIITESNMVLRLRYRL